MVTKKKKILFHSDFSLAKTGFGRAAKALLTYLHNTGKYEIVHYCCGVNYSYIDLQRTPWKSVGALPDDPQELDRLNRDPNLFRLASYGHYLLDKVILDEKPDIYIATQDFWGVDYAIDRYWFDKTNSVIWTTLDSLPLLPACYEKAPKIKNYWIWSDFATKELHRAGHTHVKTVHGPIDDSSFKRLSNSQKATLRKIFKIPADAFVVGFVFRNQLRKSVPNLLEGYKLFKERNPEVKNTYLLLHTHFGEGWDIFKLADEYKVPHAEILTTYICKKCKRYEIKSFTGQDLNCPYCRTEKSQTTTNVTIGVTEEELNEIYNLMDVYCHPFTSGGQEIPIQEAKLTGLITLVTNYSCGEECCQEGSGSLPLEWAEYREPNTQFRKASTLPSSIAKQLYKVWNASPEKRLEQGNINREWALKNYSIKNIGKQFEELLDSFQPVSPEAFDAKQEEKDPNASIDPVENNVEWVKSLYKKILKGEVLDSDEGLRYWVKSLNEGMPRGHVENYFRQVAVNDNAKLRKTSLEDLLEKNGKKRYLLIIKESIGDIFLTTSLFESLSEQYPDHDLYVACDPKYFEILEGNPYIRKVIPYIQEMESEVNMTGIGKHKGYFDVYCNVAIGTQRQLNYLTNNNIAIDV